MFFFTKNYQTNFLRFVLGFILFFISSYSLAAKILEIPIEGSIGPATSDFVQRSITDNQDCELILITLNTPGGLATSMREIIKVMLNSTVPIAVYVSPSGARAASAGTYLLYGATIAIMAPGTHLGAASPVNMATGMGDNKKTPSTLSLKANNDALAYIRTLAELRGRDVGFAEDAVKNAATLTASEALAKGVINFVAKDKFDLVHKLNGKEVVQNNKVIKLNLDKAQFELVHPDWRTKFLFVITNPTIAYLLLLLGIYGIFFELVNPGFFAPGVIGAVAMLVALYALQLMPINYAGLGLIILGVIFVIAEAFAPSFGALGFGGTVAFVFGSIFLIDTQLPGYTVAWQAILAMALVNILIFIILLSMAIRAKAKPVCHGASRLIGATGNVLNCNDDGGQAIINGEIWNIKCSSPIAPNKKVKVISVRGLTLKVEEVKGDK